jgi:sugar lactone lactonase YvrE
MQRRSHTPTVFIVVTCAALLLGQAWIASAEASSRPGCPQGLSPYQSSPTVLAACGDRLLPRKSITSLPGGGNQDNYETANGTQLSVTVPPASFDATTASAVELKRYGIPEAPPVGSPEYAKWKQMIDEPIHFVTPPSTLVEVPLENSGTEPPSATTAESPPWDANSLAPVTVAKSPAPTNAGEGSDKVWSGYLNWGGEGKFTQATGYFIDPSTKNKTTACEAEKEEVGSATWVGIGGWHDPNVGLAQDGVVQGGFEGVGANEAFVETIAPKESGHGAVMTGFHGTEGAFFKAEVKEVSKNTFNYFMYNYATKEAWPAKGTSKGETTSGGKTTEYVVERPFGEGLYDFNSVRFQAFTNNKPLREYKTERIDMEGNAFLKNEQLVDEWDATPSNIIKNADGYDEFTDSWHRCKPVKKESVEEIAENLGPAGPSPVVTTGGSSEVTETSVKLAGTVNPEGYPTGYHFEYGTEAENFSESTPETSAGEGKAAVPGTGVATALRPGTTYHYRIIADNGYGTAVGSEATFTTKGTTPPPPPSVTTEGASGLGTTTATLEGSVNPNGLDTHYFFEYGKNGTLFESFAPALPGNDAGSGSVPIKVAVGLTELTPSARYCYRIVASNMTGSSYGTEREFSTPFTPPAYSSSFGSIGSKNGQFNDPTFNAVDPTGDIWVSDSAVGNSRIEEFSSEGAFIRAVGSYGSGNGQFNDPTGIGINNSGDVYVADYSNNRIEEFSPEGVFIRTFGSFGSGNGQMVLPEGVAVDSNGDVWVAEGNNRIEEFSSTGTFIAAYGTSGSGNGQLSKPRGLTVDASNHIYVVDYGNDRVEEFSVAGAYLSQFGIKGTGNGQFSNPYTVATDPKSGEVFVTDEGNERVEAFTSSGVFLGQFGSYGTGNGQFIFPHGIAISSSGDVYVVDTGNNRVQKFLLDGC